MTVISQAQTQPEQTEKSEPHVSVEPICYTMEQLCVAFGISFTTLECLIRAVPPKGLFKIGRKRLIIKKDAENYAQYILTRGGVSSEEIREAV